MTKEYFNGLTPRICDEEDDLNALKLSDLLNKSEPIFLQVNLLNFEVLFFSRSIFSQTANKCSRTTAKASCIKNRKMSPTSILRVVRRQSINSYTPRLTPSIRPIRPFSQTSLSRYPRKDSQDRESINAEPTEYSKSGSDAGAAKQEEAAFDPETTRPEEEHKKAGEGEVSYCCIEVGSN